MENACKRLALGLTAALVFTSVAAATPIGTLSIANVQTGGVNVSAGTIDFFPPTGGGIGQFTTGNPTSITYNPTPSTSATLTASTNPFGEIKDITVGPGGITDFIRFYPFSPVLPAPGSPTQTYPAFDLLNAIAGGSNQGALNNCAGVTQVGVSCSPLIGGSFVSPFILTNRGAYTDISIGFNLLGRDASGLASLWSGGFTTQVIEQGGVRLTPDAIQTLINQGGTITNTYSGTFTFQNAIPEPGTYLMLGSGLLLLGLVRRRARA